MIFGFWVFCELKLFDLRSWCFTKIKSTDFAVLYFHDFVTKERGRNFKIHIDFVEIKY